MPALYALESLDSKDRLMPTKLPRGAMDAQFDEAAKVSAKRAGNWKS